MKPQETWPPLRWRAVALAFWVVVAIFFVVVFNIWPETARSTAFRATSFVVIIVLTMGVLWRMKSRT